MERRKTLIGGLVLACLSLPVQAADSLVIREGHENLINAEGTGTIYASARDAELRAATPDANFDGGSIGVVGPIGERRFRIDADEAGEASHVLLGFDDPFADLPAGATITSAFLALTFEGPGGAIEILPIQPTVAWDETSVTWNSFGTTGGGVVPGLDTLPPVNLFLPQPGLQFLDVTPMVVDWHEGVTANNGMALFPMTPEEVDLRGIHFDVDGTSSRPCLIINFFPPLPGPGFDFLLPPQLGLGDLYTELILPAPPGTLIGVSQSPDMEQWTITAPMQEVPLALPPFDFDNPNFFHHDRLGDWFDTYYYRIDPTVPFVWFEWMDSFPIQPLPLEDVLQHPYFEWQPFPGPVVSYELQIFPTLDNGEGVPFMLPDPLVVIPELPQHFYLWELDPFLDPFSQLFPDTIYMWMPIAILDDGRRVQGQPIPFNGGAGKNVRGLVGNAPLPAGAAAAAPDPDPVEESLRKRFKTLDLLIRKCDEIEDELDNNPLVQESDLFTKLYKIQRNFDVAKDLVVELLKQNSPDLTDPTTALKVVCFFDDTLDLLLRYDLKIKGGKNVRGVTKAQREKLETLKAKLKSLKERIDAAIKAGNSIASLITELESEINNAKNEIVNGKDPLEFLLERIEKELFEFLQKKIEAALADAKNLAIKRFPILRDLISIYNDLKNTTDAISTIIDKQFLSIQINDLMIGAVRSVPDEHPLNATCDETLSLAFALIPDFQQRNCQVKVEVRKRCFKKKAGSTNTEGNWEETPIPLEDDGFEGNPDPNEDGSITFTAGDMLIAPNGARGNAIWGEVFDMPVDPNNMKCPAGQGPCFVEVRLTFLCPNSPPVVKPWILFGVIKCDE